MKKMKLPLLLFFMAFSLLPISLFSMDWPVESGVMKVNFGLNDQGQPILGVGFEYEGPIGAAEQGELLFQNKKDNGASRLVSPLGSWVALDHGGGIISIYSRMARNERLVIPEIIYKNSLVGTSGASGWTDTKGVYFSLFDRKGRRWINPAMIVIPLPESRAPQILSVKLRNQEGSLISPSGTVNQGRYTIIAEAAEIFERTTRSPLAPFRIICSINGSEIGRLGFETYSARDGSLMVYRNGLIPVRQIYAPYPAFELGTASFARGQVTLEIIAQNAAEESRNVVYRFTVE